MKDFLRKEHKKGVNPVVAAVAGVAVGVGIAAATTSALKNKDTRKKLDKLAGEVKDRAGEYLEKVRNEPKAKKTVKTVKKTKKAAKK